MKKHQIFGMLALVLLLAFSLVFAGCDSGSSDSDDGVESGNTTSVYQPSKGGGDKAKEPLIDYTVEEYGGFESRLDTTNIIITFSKPIPGIFDGGGITFGSNSEGLFVPTKCTPEVNSDGGITKYTFDVIVLRQGRVDFKINKYGVVSSSKKLTIFKGGANLVPGDPISLTVADDGMVIPGGFPMNNVTITKDPSAAGPVKVTIAEGTTVTFEGTTTVGEDVVLYVEDANSLKGTADSVLTIEGTLKFPTNTPPSFSNFADGAKIVTSEGGAWEVGNIPYIGDSGSMFELDTGADITVEIKGGKPEFQLSGGITANAGPGGDQAWIGPEGVTFVVTEGSGNQLTVGANTELVIVEGAALTILDADNGLAGEATGKLIVMGTLSIPNNITSGLANFINGGMLIIASSGKLNTKVDDDSNASTPPVDHMYIGTGGDFVLEADSAADLAEGNFKNKIVIVMESGDPVFNLYGNATVQGSPYATVTETNTMLGTLLTSGDTAPTLTTNAALVYTINDFNITEDSKLTVNSILVVADETFTVMAKSSGTKGGELALGTTGKLLAANGAVVVAGAAGADGAKLTGGGSTTADFDAQVFKGATGTVKRINTDYTIFDTL